MIKMSIKEASFLTQGVSENELVFFTGVSTDTRTLQPGNLFIAIKGEKFNGHDFIEEAHRKGASAALISEKRSLPIPSIQVNDTLEAFGKLSDAWRSRFSLPIIGVTGSNGKTTLKNMIASILRAACQGDASKVLATEGNLNNNIGVPMMLCRLNEEHRYAVIEMGMNHFNEIEYLTQLTRPDVAVINNAAEAHLEGLKNVAGVAKAKGEIFLGLSKKGTAILNHDDAHYDYWFNLVNNSHPSLSFGLDVLPSDISANMLSHQFILICTPKGEIEVNLPLLGKHNVRNALAATAATLALGLSLEFIKTGLEAVHPAPGRMQQYFLSNGTRVIDDTYNANPFSLEAAVNTLASFPGERIVVLGDMKELGPDEVHLHALSGTKIKNAGIQYLFTFGQLSAVASESFGSNAQHFIEREPLIHALQAHLKADTTILVKGSRSMRMEKILAGIIPAEQLEQIH